MQEGVIFSDESGHDSTNQYGAICAVSGPLEELRKLHLRLESVLKTYNKTELKFQKICSSPLNSWTKFEKQIRTVNLDFYGIKKKIYT